MGHFGQVRQGLVIGSSPSPQVVVWNSKKRIQNDLGVIRCRNTDENQSCSHRVDWSLWIQNCSFHPCKTRERDALDI